MAWSELVLSGNILWYFWSKSGVREGNLKHMWEEYVLWRSRSYRQSERRMSLEVSCTRWRVLSEEGLNCKKKKKKTKLPLKHSSIFLKMGSAFLPLVSLEWSQWINCMSKVHRKTHTYSSHLCMKETSEEEKRGENTVFSTGTLDCQRD